MSTHLLQSHHGTIALQADDSGVGKDKQSTLLMEFYRKQLWGQKGKQAGFKI